MTGRADEVTATTVARWLRDAAAVLETRSAEIDALNVFPVADSDTGTNVLHTVRAAAEGADAVRGRDPHAGAGEVLTGAARAAMIGARGNSGTILSQIFVALAAQVGRAETFGAAELVDGLGRGSTAAREAVAEPRDGTVLTVLAQAHARAHDRRDDGLAAVVRAAARGAGEALERTPDQLEVLAAAGVVDAGGLGLVLLLDALAGAITGEVITRPRFRRSADAQLGRSGTVISTISLTGPAAEVAAGQDGGHGGGHGDTGCGADPDHYEVMYLLDADDQAAVDRLRAELDAAGDSVVVVSDGAGAWSVHVHLADAGRAIELGLSVGQIRQVQITHLGVQQSRNEAVRPGRVVLAVVRGTEVGELFRGEGAEVYAVDGKAAADGLLEAVLGLEAGEVVLLPNGLVRSEDLVAVSAAARPHGRQVLALPSGSMVQGLASLAVHDPRRPANDDTYTMAEAAAATRTAHLQLATKKALTWAGTCRPGDALGLIGDEIVVVEARPATAAETLIDLMLATGGELVTVVAGQTADAALLDGIEDHLAGRHPAVELMVYAGGQPDDILQIGVE